MSNKEEQKYNGWTNYETWAIKLWMDNDEGEYEYWQETAKEILNSTKGEEAEQKLASEMKEHFEENAEEALKEEWKASVFSDLLNAGLAEVNWYEVAKAVLEEINPKEEKKKKLVKV